MVSMEVLIRTFSSGIHTHPVSWNLRMELSNGGCFPNLVRNCRWTIVPLQSFWITLYNYKVLGKFLMSCTFMTHSELAVEGAGMALIQSGMSLISEGWRSMCVSTKRLNFWFQITVRQPATGSVIGPVYMQGATSLTRTGTNGRHSALSEISVFLITWSNSWNSSLR